MSYAKFPQLYNNALSSLLCQQCPTAVIVNIKKILFRHFRETFITQAGIKVISWAHGQSDRTAKSAHAEINDKQGPAGADLFCAPANITKFFSLMLPFFAGKPIFSLGGWEDVNIGYVAEMLMCVWLIMCKVTQTDSTLNGCVKTRLAAAVINADSRQSLHKSQQRKWHKNTL